MHALFVRKLYSSHSAAGLMAKVQVRLLSCLSFIRCIIYRLKTIEIAKKKHDKKEKKQHKITFNVL